MTVSCHGVCGREYSSPSQSKLSSTTTHFGMAAASSDVSSSRSASSPFGTYGSVLGPS
jgi:hypothetical protein